jgi:hypothetical protein
MKLSSLFLVVPAALFVLGSGAASAGEAISDAGAFACVFDKWDETEPEKAHKWVDYVGRCVGIPDAPAAPKYTEDCVGKFEYMPDGSWKGSGTCTFNFKGGARCMAALRRVRTSRSPTIRLLAAPAYLRARVAAAPTRTRNLRTPSLAEDTKASWCCPDLNGATTEFRCSDVSAKVLNSTEDAQGARKSSPASSALSTGLIIP